jgi:hypothetical protein
MKKLIKIARLLLLTLPLTVQAEDYTYKTNNGAITITSYTGSGGAVTITNNINGLPVTSIGTNAFYNCTNLTSVIIPNGVTNIGGYAFYNCTGLTNASIPDSVTSIRTYAFNYCKKLLSITIPDGVISIGSYAFYATALTNIIIPISVAQIGERAFPLQTLKAIQASELNPWYSSTNGVLFNKDKTTLVLYPGGAATSYEIPNYVSCVGTHAFDLCTKLTGVTIPSGITRIEDHAFYCTGLTNIVIPSCVTNIGERTFTACSRLTAIDVDPLNQYYSSINGVLFNKSQTVIIAYPERMATSYKIPNSVGSIGDNVFYSCGSLVSVVIPNGVTNIGSYAFLGCYGLTGLTIPSGVTSIGHDAFYKCSGLTGVYFQGNAPSLGTYVFSGTTNATVYYLSGTTGWTNTFGGRPTMLWNPKIQTSDADFGVSTNGFGFNIAGTNNFTVVVEACTNLAEGIWVPVKTNTLIGGSVQFSDPAFTNYPSRYYRVSMPQ